MVSWCSSTSARRAILPVQIGCDLEVTPASDIFLIYFDNLKTDEIRGGRSDLQEYGSSIGAELRKTAIYDTGQHKRVAGMGSSYVSRILSSR